MTSSNSFQRGWNKPVATGEKCLWIYVAADETVTAYFKGRIDGAAKSVKLEGDTITGWRKQVARLRGDDDAAEAAVGNRKVKVGEWALGEYAEAQRKLVTHPDKELRRSRRSVENDIDTIERFIAKTSLGRMKFGDVKIGHVRKWLNDLTYTRQANGEYYASGTRGNIVRVLCSIFREAKKADLVARNVTRDLEAGEKPSRKPGKEKRYLTIEQVDALMAELGPVFHPIVFLCAWAGMRISEVLGLTWENFDLDAGTMTVELQLDVHDRVGLKTGNSNATVGLLPQVLELLRNHRRETARRGLQHVRDEALVFTTLTGKPQGRRNALRALQNAADKLGMNVDAKGNPTKKVDLHSLRHSLISNGIDAGMTFAEMAHVARNDERTIVAVYTAVAEQKRGVVTTTKLAERIGRTG